MSSLKPIGNIVVICCAFFIIFGILGVQHCEPRHRTYLFSPVHSAHYDSYTSTFMYVLVVMEIHGSRPKSQFLSLPTSCEPSAAFRLLPLNMWMFINQMWK
ncbi:Voltage-dependent T-type calcium channel subunit alpha-1G [Liparis tanakae]|uniref:Voltage-dependent T-type calcium channel subunit alpha-1G n=1 Tax=Liparis tanakae TaxID=230148 RepID=A0A4Z2FZI1_9TELE|nr:Voltage-dependent T-type calcium channel subunit alpha-1G [Liparis tanakae]